MEGPDVCRIQKYVKREVLRCRLMSALYALLFFAGVIIESHSDWIGRATVHEYVVVGGILIGAVVASILYGKIGTKRLWMLTRTMPVSPTVEYMPMLVHLLKYVVSRQAAGERIGAVLQQLTVQDAQTVQTHLWRAIYRHFWRGAVGQRQTVVRAALLRSDRSALPYLRRMLRCGSAPAELQRNIDAAIAVLEKDTI